MSQPPEPTPRLQEFQSEVDALKVGGGKANPERTWLKVSIAGWIIAIVIEIVAYVGSHGTKNDLVQRDNIVIALIGVVVAVISTGLFVTYSLTRYFRYWLIRLIYQDRESSDRLIEALKR